MECDGCKWEHWMPESSNEPWCLCDICEDGDQFEKGVNHDGKAKKIAELLKDKGTILVRNAHKYEGGKWYVHCWLEKFMKDPVNAEDTFCRHICTNEKEIYNQYVDDINKALDEIIEKLEVLKDGI